MILLQRYIFKELVYNFIFSFVVISAVILLATLLQVIFQNPILGLDMVVLLVPFILLGIMSIVVPASCLVAVVTTYGRMASDNEILTLSASGVHFYRAVVPCVLFGLIISFLLLIANDRYIPQANMKAKVLANEQDIYPLLENVVKRGLTKLELEDWIITWESAEKTGSSDDHEKGSKRSGTESQTGGEWEFRGFRAKRYDQENRLEQEFFAESATVVVPDRTDRLLEFHLHNGSEVVGSGLAFSEMVLPYRLAMDSWKIRLSHRSMAALIALIDKEYTPYDNVRILTEIHSRLAVSMSPFVLIFLGLSAAVYFKYRNRMVSFFIALLIAIFIYYPVILIGETFAKQGLFHPALCIWPGNVVMLTAGVLLLRRVTGR